MKTFFLFSRLKFIIGFMFISAVMFGQGNVPQGLNYQGVARDGSGTILGNTTLTLRFSILSGTTPPYATEYVETHSVTTNQFGIFTAKVGMGTPVTGTFAGVSWKNGNQLLQTELDRNGGSSFVNLGTTQLLSVPYALSSKSSQDAWSMNGNVGTSSSTHFFGNADSVDLIFKTNNKERMIIHDNGKIGFGITNPTYKYHFRNSTTDQVALWVEGSNSSYSSFYVNALNASATSGIGLLNQGTLRGFIGASSSGNLLSFRLGNPFITGMTVSEKGWINLPEKNGKVTRSAVSDTNNVVAAAYGNITSAGVINAQGSTNNFTVSKSGTGVYNITWTTSSGINTYYTKTAVAVTVSVGGARITSWTSGGGGTVLIVYIYDAAGVAVDTDFSFIVFKP